MSSKAVLWGNAPMTKISCPARKLACVAAWNDVPRGKAVYNVLKGHVSSRAVLWGKAQWRKYLDPRKRLVAWDDVSQARPPFPTSH